jgi:hypothetical protein
MEETNNIDNTKKIVKRHCPRCKQEIEISVGLHNWKNLFKMPTFNDWMFLVMLLLVLASAYAYQHDIKACKEYIQNISLTPYDNNQFNSNQLNLSGLDLSRLEEDNLTGSLNVSLTNGQQSG